MKLSDKLNEMFDNHFSSARKEGVCGICGKKIDEKDFADKLSKEIYEASGICQECQNEIFAVERMTENEQGEQGKG